MSSSNYYRICRHPLGGYTAVLGFLTNLEDGFQVKPSENHPRFTDWADAATFAKHQEDGVEIHIDPDLLNEDRVRVLTRTYPAEVAEILRDMGYRVEAPL